MSSVDPITSVTSASTAANMYLYLTALPVSTPAGQIAYQQLQSAIKSDSLVAAQVAYVALQKAAAESRAANQAPAAPAAGPPSGDVSGSLGSAQSVE